ncbi:putative delta-1-pyrroline-5-carboxylate dehydrogenase [Trypanosoma rangeli]|uniref:Putative delta-1-pyrroline-5-carboxylate dehydrogenase n=1 Tax=Trypanosoma rangeli TaxID=5698 RepID=A0A3R7L2D8_TRYRA|nr:putative delta-1-pyrroline-5-carboxylate dehydrogenase [Trypanosoma rangeli]RNF06177.1 putative delta-1-pyrroline-5-carboxylate dehydrogenase [Trypanosoma rangeli]|eukprot:RNF06177.1 putative delta-1-pyrroline-5-carboxylate dehydrogenase [Trypanosoma rangeli]
MYARFRTRSKFYKRPERALRAYNVSPNMLRRPKVKPGLLRGVHSDETVDLRDRERLDMLESIRHPKERDFYQDHTYHNQWISRDLERHQKMQLSTRYRYFAPDYVITPWIWYPGDVVEVVSGEGVGQRGAIIAVTKYKNEIIVQNINVQDVVIPASETRPEQVVQREHPISVGRVRHVDPSTNQLCNLDVVKVRNKETGALEEKRMSLESGVLLPIPPLDSSMEVGDPLKDTPIQDSDEATYDREAEMAVLVQRRLHAMEDYFVRSLQDSYEFHEPLRAQNAKDMRSFQSGVVDAASAALAEKLLRVDGTAPPAWWQDAIAPHVEGIEAEMLATAEEEAAKAMAAAATTTTADGEMLATEVEQENGFMDEEEEEVGMQT